MFPVALKSSKEIMFHLSKHGDFITGIKTWSHASYASLFDNNI